MLQSLEEFFPAEVTWTRPKGGLFLWVTLPQGLDMKAIFNSAIEQNLSLIHISTISTRRAKRLGC